MFVYNEGKWVSHERYADPDLIHEDTAFLSDFNGRVVDYHLDADALFVSGSVSASWSLLYTHRSGQRGPSINPVCGSTSTCIIIWTSVSIRWPLRDGPWSEPATT